MARYQNIGIQIDAPEELIGGASRRSSPEATSADDAGLQARPRPRPRA